MSQLETPEEAFDQGEEIATAPVASLSLAARMAERRQQLETHVSEKFPVPGYDDLVAVELRVLGMKRTTGIIQRHLKLRDEHLQNLYGTADQILAATMAFYEIVSQRDGADEHRPLEGETWVSLARRANPKLPADVTPRQALLALVDDRQLAIWYGEWEQWMKTRRPEIDEEMAEDFVTTV